MKSKTSDREAALEQENAELRRQLAESLAQQDAVAEVLKGIAHPGVELALVLQAVVAAAHRLCRADYAVLFRKDGDAYRWAAGHAMAGGSEEQERDAVILPGTGTLIGRAVLEGRAVQIEDAWTDPHYEAKDEARDGGIHTMLGVPLLREGEAIGAIGLARGRVEPFTNQQVALVQSFAAQAVIAIENARLLTETREALDQQTATAEVLGVINSSPGDLAPVFDAMLEKAMRLCEATIGTLWTFDDDGMRAAAIRGAPPIYAEFLKQGPLPPNALQQRFVHGEPAVQIADLAASELYRSGYPLARAAVDLGGVQTLLVVALRKDDTFLGQFSIYRKEVRPFTDKQIALVKSFAAQAVIAMENARLLGELRQRTEEVAALNRDLEARVAEQVDELGRVSRLKRFLAPQLAELIVSQGDEKILESHRREIVVVFCDLRGYTAFTETAEPEEVLHFLREYHGALGPLVADYEGTLDQFSGDGIMVFFNDPVPIPDPAERAVKMAMAMREAAGALTAIWRRRGRELGFGAGISQGYATLGQIGFSERSGYTAIGTVCNVAARLCAEAKDGQILIAQRVAAGLDGDIALEDIGPLALKGITQPVVALNVAPNGSAASRLRLI